ncbi:MAG: bifunctional phosphopantothenoylcysteine decarboxylase/phosphopantothenate--cysteine ligase CoaBC [Deltaproteobacteria bacterium]|nr:MAG: bifunctional phosphopantothenoylcysteine decarboxylase/phosphopantothenate--cysteine ligase CoaBC [Deltaproteobacteria bacterium]
MTQQSGAFWAGREILLGVSGSIAAYKSAELARLFLKAGAKVQVVMTSSAKQFIAPLTFFSLTGRPVYDEMFSGGPEEATAHIELARRADLVVVAPATAQLIGRLANGLASDLLSTTIIAADTPVVIAPAMNPQMFAHPAVDANIKTIASWPGYAIAPPTEGELACGEFGLGRLADPPGIVEFCEWFLSGGKQDLQGEHVVVTAGPTFEDLDPVRFLSNRSTGKMGFAIAQVAARRGAQVSLVSSVSPPTPIPGCNHVKVRSAQSMHDAIHALLPETTALVMAAAVADYKPKEQAPTKIKKKAGPLAIELDRNPDILASLPKDPKRITVGFAAETDHVEEHALGKLKRKHLDMIVANDVTQPGSGFGVDTNQVVLLKADGSSESLPMLSKVEVAERLLDQVRTLRAAKERS